MGCENSVSVAAMSASCSGPTSRGGCACRVPAGRRSSGAPFGAVPVGRLFRADAGGSGHFRPALRVVCDHRDELGGRVAGGIRAGVEDLLLRHGGEPTMPATAAFRRATMSAGVPAGASRPYHCRTSKPGRPDSITVGTSGSRAWRSREPMATGRSRPALTPCGRMGGSTMNSRSASPESTAVTGGCPALVLGHVHDAGAGHQLEELADMCPMLPAPDDE